jgi:hypothetical protein
VWLAWAACLAVAAAFAVRYGRRFPFADDWGVVKVLTGQRDFSLGWLWSQSAEHRYFTPRLIVYAVTWLSHGDMRPMVGVNVALLAGAAAFAIVQMRRVRGTYAVSDAFFAVVLLVPFQYGLTWSYMVHFIMVQVTAIAVLVVIARFGLEPPVRWLWFSAAAVVVLFGCGAQGLSLIPGVLLWFLLSARRLGTTEAGRGTARTLYLFVGGVVLAAGLYFVGYSSSGVPIGSPFQALRGAFRFSTAAAGPGAFGYWPATGVAVLVAVGGTVALLAVAARRNDTDAAHAIALLCFGGSVMTFLLAFGLGRGSVEWTAARFVLYAALITPLSCWVYVCWVRFGREYAAPVGIALLVAAVGVYGVNFNYMRTRYAKVEQERVRFERDICDMPLAEAAKQHEFFLYVGPSPRELNDAVLAIEEYRRSGGAAIYDC